MAPPYGYEVVRSNGKVYFRKAGDPEGSIEHPFAAHFRKRIYEDSVPQPVPEPEVKGHQHKLTPKTFATPARLFVSDGEANDKAAVDYNEIFQDLWSQSPLQPEQLKEREVSMLVLLKKFEEDAVEAAMEFVHETSTTNRNQRVRKGNLLLSYQNSSKAIRQYGGRAYAVKMHQHELMGIRCVMSSDLRTLHLPLTCTVHYIGNRVTVAAAVPTGESKVLGPDDLTLAPPKRGYTLSEEPQSLLGIVAADYRLAPHHVPGQGEPLITHGAAANEVRKGLDGRMYVTQSSRMMPPLPMAQVNAHEFRPEFVKVYRQGEGLEHFMTAREEELVAEMKKYQVEESIQFFADWLTSPQGTEAVGDGADFADVFHHFGINISRIKMVHDAIEAKKGIASELREQRCKSLRTEMLARGLKALFRKRTDTADMLSEFLDDPNALLNPVTTEKYGWDLLNPRISVPVEAVLLRVSALMTSIIQFEKTSDGRVKITEVVLNKESMTELKILRPLQFVYTYANGYTRLRPEIMRALNPRQASTHISSDALSIEAVESDFQNDAACIEALASSVLLKDEIPQFASDILRRPPEDQGMLCNLAHESGINLHFLGVVLFHLLEWKDDGDWRTVRDTTTSHPVALQMVLTEILARTFCSSLEDALQGCSYGAAATKTREQLQRLLDDQDWMWDKAREKFYFSKQVQAACDFPPASGLVGRCCQLVGAVVVMKAPDTVGDVMLQPVAKTLSLPPHLKALWLVEEEQAIDVNILPAIEHQLVDRVAARPKQRETLVPLLALLSLVYQRWGREDAEAKQQELHDVRQQLVDLTQAGSIEHADANLMMGDYFRSINDDKKASSFYGNAYRIYDKLLGKQQNTLDAALGMAMTLSISGEDRDALVWFELSRKLAMDLKVSDEKLLEIETLAGECCALQGKHEDAVKYYTQAIDLMRELPNHEEIEIARLLEARARSKYSLAQYSDSANDFQTALAIFYKQYGMDCTEIADISVCLGQLQGFQNKLQESKDSFEVALQIYEKAHGPNSDESRMLLTDHLAPCYQKMGQQSQQHKCLLQVLLMDNPEDSQPIATKYFEIAVAYEKEKSTDRAVKYFQLSLAALRKLYGDDHKHVQKCKQWLEHLGGVDPSVRPPIKEAPACVSPRYHPVDGDRTGQGSQVAKPQRRNSIVLEKSSSNLGGPKQSGTGTSPQGFYLVPPNPGGGRSISGRASRRMSMLDNGSRIVRKRSSYNPLPIPEHIAKANAAANVASGATLTVPGAAPARPPGLEAPQNTNISMPVITGPNGDSEAGSPSAGEPRTIRSMLCKTGFGTFRNIQFARVEGNDEDSSSDGG
eukprot:TRINITY_DN2821_c0_g5_i1.p1 TRINITY_DN2821_c0_g5~~TRINITY_DN2821_c0_g5_i1.p1  ORF type:complete len:1437 (+),score=635.43 TRINITY_DN2821_c0_g5_i1:319-4311(+)